MKSKYQDDTKMFDMYAKNRYSCKCGHRVLILNKDKKICSWCGRYVYKDKKQEFKDKLKEKGVKCD